MSTPANPRLIGAFVLGGLLLALGALFLFGGGQIFAPKLRYVMYFGTSVNGLDVGAPVRLRGVPVGEVADIDLHFGADGEGIGALVAAEFAAGETTGFQPAGRTAAGLAELIDDLVARGLRAQLQLASAVTGKLFVELVFEPDSEPVRVLTDSDDPELPTVPSKLERITSVVDEFVADLRQMPFKELVQHTTQTMAGLDQLVNSDEIAQAVGDGVAAIAEARVAIAEVRATVAGLGARIGPLAERLDAVLTAGAAAADEAREAAGAGRELIVSAHGELQPALADLGVTLATARRALEQAETAMAGLRNLTGEESNERHELHRTLRELSAAARSIRVMADYLERHPDALIRGKSP